MKRVKDLMPEVLRKQPQKELPIEEIVRAAWGQIAGKQIAARSRVFRVYQDTLIVNVPDKMWQRQLRRLYGALVYNVNRFVGREAIKTIDFRVDETLLFAPPQGPPGPLFAAAAGEGPASAAPPRKAPGRELSPAVEEELVQAASAIGDPELRELFLSASRKMVK